MLNIQICSFTIFFKGSISQNFKAWKFSRRLVKNFKGLPQHFLVEKFSWRENYLKKLSKLPHALQNISVKALKASRNFHNRFMVKNTLRTFPTWISCDLINEPCPRKHRSCTKSLTPLNSSHRNPKRFSDTTIHLQLLLVDPHTDHNWRNSNARKRDGILVRCCRFLGWCLNIRYYRW